MIIDIFDLKPQEEVLVPGYDPAKAEAYQAVGHKLLNVDELPQGALARYERDIAAFAHFMEKNQWIDEPKEPPVEMKAKLIADKYGLKVYEA